MLLNRSRQVYTLYLISLHGQCTSKFLSSNSHTYCRYSALNVKDLDDVPLMSEDGGAGEGGDSEDEENTFWEAGGSRTRWKRRIRSHTTLVSLFLYGGWLVVLKK